ncbi:hypothetical protein V8F20_008624 [Naviculisporaceae sp. PSN 640]
MDTNTLSQRRGRSGRNERLRKRYHRKQASRAKEHNDTHKSIAKAKEGVQHETKGVTRDANRAIAEAQERVRAKTTGDTRAGSQSTVAATDDVDGDATTSQPPGSNGNRDSLKPTYSTEQHVAKLLSTNKRLRQEQNKFKKEFKKVVAHGEATIAKLEAKYERVVQQHKKIHRQTMKQVAELNAAMFYLLHRGPNPGAAATATAASASARAAGVAPSDLHDSADGEAAAGVSELPRGGYVSTQRAVGILEIVSESAMSLGLELSGAEYFSQQAVVLCLVWICSISHEAPELSGVGKREGSDHFSVVPARRVEGEENKGT